MTILLINDNPVVSRLLSLCTRDDDMILEKVSSIDEASDTRYDVLFADEASCQGDIASLSTRLDVGKKIYLSYNDDPMAGFDETVKKPFLPSQIIEILKTVEVREVEDEVLMEEPSMDVPEIEELNDNDEVPSIFPLSAEEIDEEELSEEAEEESEEEQSEEENVSLAVLDRDEIERIKALLDMDEEEAEELDLNEEAYESRKIEVIKEQLIADGLEIFEEEEIVDEISRFKEKKEKSKKQLDKKQKPKKTEKKKKKKSKNKKLTEGELSAIEDAVEEMIKNLKPKEVKKLLKGKEIDVKIHLEDKK
ncbi:hypothetical protein [Sulfurovum sp.]|uniref:hypothetical protein n=1 Tax=Sulfurovum sp. TaxID=1969726 RepID=UPI002867B0FB|nr:hypothetical protein [Sulfurovum sp.]